jgi:glycine dehydrogenase subunit 1
MTLLGRQGLGELAGLCAAKATYAKQRLAEIPLVRIDTALPTFNEFVVHLPRDAAAVVGNLIDKGFAAGFPLGRYYPSMQNDLLVAVTEKRTKEQIGALAEALEGVL